MKKLLLLCTGLLLIAATSVSFAEGKAQTHCPVMPANPVNHNSQYVDVDGYRIYVCCSMCAKAIKANPEKYIEKMKAEGIEIEKTPAK